MAAVGPILFRLWFWRCPRLGLFGAVVSCIFICRRLCLFGVAACVGLALSSIVARLGCTGMSFQKHCCPSDGAPSRQRLQPQAILVLSYPLVVCHTPVRYYVLYDRMQHHVVSRSVSWWHVPVTTDFALVLSLEKHTSNRIPDISRM